MRLRRVVALAELWDGDMAGYVVEGCKLVLIRSGDDVRAFEDRCAHLGVAMSEGTLVGGVLTCRAHLYQYDARTGCGINPENVKLRAYPVAVRDGGVYVDLDGGA